MDLIFYSIWISLFDSLSTTLQIVVFVLLLTTQRPVRNALAYLAGLCGTYYACGVAVYPVLDAAKALLGRFFPSRVPDGIYYQAELLTGLVMVGIGVLYFYRRKKACFGRTENMVVA
ncbi:MAG TPA: GAP family protein, partial [bacterium]|nr:GAP family protein [bacterium]